MLIQVDGWFGAGKSVLWMLLDNHPDVFCSPVHDYAYAAFLNQGNDFDWVKTKHTEILRKALARTQYYKFEKVFWDGFMSFEFSSENVLKLPYSVNYYNFDYSFIKTLMADSEWTLEKITDTLYSAVHKEVQKYKPETKLPTCFASMSNPLFIDDYENFPKVFSQGKSIQVRRSVEHIIAVRSNRKARPEDFKTWKFFSDSFEKRMEEGEVEKILSFYDKYDVLVEKFPEIFMVVSFDDLVLNTGSAMTKVTNFLGIDFHDQLLKATYQGKELMHNGKKYIGQANDKVEDLLSAAEIEIILNRKEEYFKRNRAL
jgi:hypothetical protein